MEAFTSEINTVNGSGWSVPMLVLILGVSIFLSLGLKLMPILTLGTGNIAGVARDGFANEAGLGSAPIAHASASAQNQDPVRQGLVAIALALFAFPTIIGWSLYGERCVTYLFGVKAVLPYRILWVLAIPVGAGMSLDLVWLVADTLNAMMALPNLIALLALSPVVFRLTRAYFGENDTDQPLATQAAD